MTVTAAPAQAVLPMLFADVEVVSVERLIDETGVVPAVNS